MKLLIATDAWTPQVNGVVRTYERLEEELSALGTEAILLTPQEFHTVPAPSYPEIRLAIPGWSYVAERFRQIKPDAVHIATEGPIGWMTRSYCRRHAIPFTTSFHTRFPEYLQSRFYMPAAATWSLVRRFHNSGEGTMVATPSLAEDLNQRGFKGVMSWTRGVDTELFRPRDVRRFGPAPVFLYVGRVALEKNIEAFLSAPLDGTKVVVGGGPQLEALKRQFPEAIFTGKQIGEDLAECYASADVFVFPSKTDTFGIVLLEAMASGLPVAAYPVTGPIDVVAQGVSGVLDEDLATAARAALALDPTAVRQSAVAYSWESAARLFLSNIETALFARQGRAVPARKSRKVRMRGLRRKTRYT